MHMIKDLSGQKSLEPLISLNTHVHTHADRDTDGRTDRQRERFVKISSNKTWPSTLHISSTITRWLPSHPTQNKSKQENLLALRIKKTKQFNGLGNKSPVMLLTNHLLKDFQNPKKKHQDLSASLCHAVVASKRLCLCFDKG